MINDSHIHVGQFYDTYTSPQDLSLLMTDLGVDRYAVSSTTVCEKNFSKVLKEIQSLIDIDGERIIPVLWISPEFFLDKGLMKNFLESGIIWRCIKIHPDWQPNVWTENLNRQKLIKLARRLNVPILIHTGGHDYSESIVWEQIIKDNPDQKFILAHSRPFSQAISMISKYENAYGDLAFVDASDYKELHNKFISRKFLWGSDLPILNRFINRDMKTYYNELLGRLRDSVDEREFEQITKINFDNLYKS